MVYVPAVVGMAWSVSWRPIPHSAPAAHVLEAMTVPLGSRSSASRSGPQLYSKQKPGNPRTHSGAPSMMIVAPMGIARSPDPTVKSRVHVP